MTDFVVRHDTLPIGKVQTTDEGFIRGTAHVTRVGVFKYLLPDGTIRRELRHPDEVFAQDSMDSMKLIPITNDHPKERIVTADNAKALQVGSTGETVMIDHDHLVASVLITHADAIKVIRRGKKELSLGYTAVLVKEDGEYNGEQYDYRQTDIRYNHLSIVERGRAGHTARLNLDAEDGVCIMAENDKNNGLVTVNVDGLQYQASPEVARALDKATTEVAKLSGNVNTATARADAAEARADAAEARVAELEKLDHTDSINTAVKKRVALVGVAGRVLDEDAVAKMDSMSDIEVMKAVIAKKHPEAQAKLDTASDAYVEARFDAVVETLGNPKDQQSAKNRETTTSAERNDGEKDVVLDARQRMVADMTGQKKED